MSYNQAAYTYVLDVLNNFSEDDIDLTDADSDEQSTIDEESDEESDEKPLFKFSRNKRKRFVRERTREKKSEQVPNREVPFGGNDLKFIDNLVNSRYVRFHYTQDIYIFIFYIGYLSKRRSLHWIIIYLQPHSTWT